MAVKEKLSLVDRFKRLLRINKDRHEEVILQKSEYEQNLIKGAKRKITARRKKRNVQKASRVNNRNK